VSPNGLGGGIENLGSLTVENCVFEDCTAFLLGGAVYSVGSATISGSKFAGNSAQRGGAIYAEGTLTLTDNEFSDNAASVQDGDVGGPAQISACGNTGGIEDTDSCISAGSGGPSIGVPSYVRGDCRSTAAFAVAAIGIVLSGVVI